MGCLQSKNTTSDEVGLGRTDAGYEYELKYSKTANPDNVFT